MMAPIESKYCEILAKIKSKPYAPRISHLFCEYADVDLRMFCIITDQPTSEWRTALTNAMWWSGANLSGAEQSELCDLVIPFLTVLIKYY